MSEISRELFLTYLPNMACSNYNIFYDFNFCIVFDTNLDPIYSVLIESSSKRHFTVISFSIWHSEDGNTRVKEKATAALPTCRNVELCLMSLLSFRLVFNVFSLVETKIQLDTINRQ